MANLRLAPFDPAREFVATRDFLCRGRTYRRGQDFDRLSVTTRTLRLLYEGRSIDYRGGQPAPKSPIVRHPFHFRGLPHPDTVFPEEPEETVEPTDSEAIDEAAMNVPPFEWSNPVKRKFVLQHTLAQLVEIAAAQNPPVEHDPMATKAAIVDLLAEAGYVPTEQ